MATRTISKGVPSSLVVLLVATLLVLAAPAVVLAAEVGEDEPNGTLAEATPVSGGSVVYATSNSSADLDLYRIDLVTGQELGFHVAFDGAAADLDLYLVDPAGRTVDVSDAAEGDAESVGTVATLNGTYYLRVEPFDLAGPVGYVATVVVDTAPTPVPVYGDFEPNELAVDAVPIDPLENGYYAGTVSNGTDRDVYAVGLLAGDELRVDLAFVDPTADLELIVVAPQGEVLASSEGLETDAAVTLVAPANGTYFVAVWPIADTVTEPVPYTLLFNRTVGPVASPAGADEPNGQFTQAVELGNGSYNSTAQDRADLDIYAVSVEAGDTVAFELLGGGEDLDIFLYDMNLRQLDRSVTTMSTENVSAVADTPGPHYLLVVPYSVDTPTEYTVVVSVTPAATEAENE